MTLQQDSSEAGAAGERQDFASLATEVEPWLAECGSCDAGLPMACTHPEGDYRSILLKVWRAYAASQTSAATS